MNIHTVYRPLLRYFHGRRWARFIEALRVSRETRILDVGGVSTDRLSLAVCPNVSLLNIRPEPNCPLPQVIADGRALPFKDRSFEIVFSNSVIEHLGSPEQQRAFVLEISRLGQKYWVQTPNRWFPFEPHLLTSFVQWLPRRWPRGTLPFDGWERFLGLTKAIIAWKV